MLKPGDLVGPYEIRGFLGQGGMGQVYKAFDPRLERTVALKVIVVPARSSEGDSERLVSEFSARLLREARAVASLSHPNVVGIYDVGESGDRLYLAMEYVVGATLRSLAATADVPVARKLRWLVDIARALEIAHRAGLVHRDVKPENVMIREDGAVKVLDFGIARRTMTAAGADQQQLDTITGSGSIAGTPVYMAPEQIKGRDVDARCDQFAWGVMAYELLAGERPWPDNGDVLQLVAKVLTEPPPPLRERVKDLPNAVEETVLRALAKEPAARFASMADAADALEPFAMQTTSGDRVRITPRIPTESDDPSAFAATTRVPTSVSVSPAPAAPGAPGPAEKTERRHAKKRSRSRRKLSQLALPLALLGALAAAVVVVRKSASITVAAEASRPLSNVPEAEKEYEDAMRQWHDGATGKARATLRHAVELDPTFAAAHLQLAIQTVQDDPAGAQASFQSAFEQRHMLVPRDSVLLEACEPYVRPRPDLDEWETRLTAAVFQFPRDAELQFFLGRAREKQGADEAAKGAYEAAVRLDSAFVPALAALANAERNLGRVPEALAATERCIKQSPVASTCLETRYRLFSEMGECHRAREEASQWRTVEPQSPLAFGAFARALYADGAPRPSVEEALSRAWALSPPQRRQSSERWDRTYLAIVDGDLAKAEQLARDFEADLPPGADQYDHAGPARVRMNVLYESDDTAGAAKVARAFLDRMDAWASYPFAPDPSIGFYEPLYRAGDITKAELDRQRARWTEREKERLAGGDRSPRAAWGIWSIWGGFAETKEEALEAIGRMPQLPLPVGSRRAVSLDFAIGKVYALVGRPREALAPLLRVTSTCSSLEDAMIVARARYYVGVAYEASGDKQEARAAYTKVVVTWPKSTPSRTVRWAAQRLAVLSK
jgi:eukaryotic-like serine/threonine-protein kinase